jgi:putative transcriptional regulator
MLKPSGDRCVCPRIPFARTYRIPVATLKGWEQVRRHPDATVSAYLRVIERYPKEVEQALAGQ